MEPAKMESAPKLVPILILFPEFDVYARQWWIGIWSHTESQWVIKTPYTVDGKAVVCNNMPNPIGWHSLPPV